MAQDMLKHAIDTLIYGNNATPFEILGIHTCGEDGDDVIIRTFQPFAQAVVAIEKPSGIPHPMRQVHEAGLFETRIAQAKPFAYRLRMTDDKGHEWETDDPYRFKPSIPDFDAHVFAEGTGYRSYSFMGAHLETREGVSGVNFCIWAPNALRVSITGAFNRWSGLHTPMQKRDDSGLWSLFVPGLQTGDLYKFEVKGPCDFIMQKADPYAFAAEIRPQTASQVWDPTGYTWQDGAWLKKRADTDWLKKPISVYEAHLGSWRRVPEENNRWLTYREMAEQLVPYVKEMGFTHIELMPVTEHPFDGSWGYQSIGYFAPTSRFGTPDDLKFFIDECHRYDIGVILDWVPAHFPKDGHGLGYFDGTHLYEHADPRKGEHMDWGTLIFNYGRNEVRAFLLSSAIFWAEVYHIDGIRVDAVASMLYLNYSREEGQWIPNEYGGNENLEAVSFLKKFNELVHQEFPGFLTFAEESTAWPMVSRPTYLGGLGFDLKWNMGWMNDMLEYIEKEAVFRKYHHNSITFSLLYAFTENFILPFSHDEVVHGKRSMLDKMPGDLWQKFANLRCLYTYMYAHPGKKLLFMGDEIGQWNEWDCHHSLQWDLLQHDAHRKLKQCVQDLNKVYLENPALYEVDFNWEGFQWIDFHDADQSVISFVRRAEQPEDSVICVFNFTPVPREGYRVGVPLKRMYEQIFNSDSEYYGGSNLGNVEVPADPIPWQDQEQSILLTVPPLAGIIMKPVKLPAAIKAIRKPIKETTPEKAPDTAPEPAKNGKNKPKNKKK
ncbi:MAG: 1,4-alpha-glucan branching protein GlgB [Spartobacteria bacterium]|nr:1,4-alpha-glucan branching protein GlgB [Spartobacteria bacterium]